MDPVWELAATALLTQHAITNYGRATRLRKAERASINASADELVWEITARRTELNFRKR